MHIEVAVIDDGSLAMCGVAEVMRQSRPSGYLGTFARLADVDAADVDAAGIDAAGIDAAGIDAADIDAAGVGRSEAGVSGRDGRVVVIVDPFAGVGTSWDEFAALPSHVRVVVMTASVDPVDLRDAIHAGARGYVGKNADVATLLAAVAAAGAGGLYLGDGLSDMLVGRRSASPMRAQPTDEPAATDGLSPRERDVLALVARGFTHKQIGTRLGLTKATVDTYVHRVRQKIGSANKAGLTRAALNLGLLERADGVRR